jgi:hypothetical protein
VIQAHTDCERNFEQSKIITIEAATKNGSTLYFLMKHPRYTRIRKTKNKAANLAKQWLAAEMPSFASFFHFIDISTEMSRRRKDTNSSDL